MKKMLSKTFLLTLGLICAWPVENTTAQITSGIFTDFEINNKFFRPGKMCGTSGKNHGAFQKKCRGIFGFFGRILEKCGSFFENHGTFSRECRTFSRHTDSNGAAGRHNGTQPTQATAPQGGGKPSA